MYADMPAFNRRSKGQSSDVQYNNDAGWVVSVFFCCIGYKDGDDVMGTTLSSETVGIVICFVVEYWALFSAG